MDANYRGWIYINIADYHRNIDPNWSFKPTYLRKMDIVKDEIQKFYRENARILDAGCGEGILVEELKMLGYSAYGIDLNYGSSKLR